MFLLLPSLNPALGSRLQRPHFANSVDRLYGRQFISKKALRIQNYKTSIPALCTTPDFVLKAALGYARILMVQKFVAS